MKRKVWKRAVVIGVLSLFLLLGLRSFLPTGAVGQTKSEWIKEALAVQNAFVEVAETTAKAVVTISTQDRVLVEDWFSRYFLGVQGLGSGVIFDKKGYVITNDHVIEIATQKVWRNGEWRTVGKVASKIRVVLPDGRSFPARVQGRDRLLDIAVLKLDGVDGQDLPVATLGDSAKLRVGRLVLAMGNPYGGYEHLDSPQPTVTDGIISALERTFQTNDERRSYGGLIQTSAAINRGNSGGPLVNLRGEVIGMNAAIFSTSQGSQGIGFAIPINRVKARLKQLIAGEKIRYGHLGIDAAEIDPRKLERAGEILGWKIPRGVWLERVHPGSPADKARLKVEDIIVKLGHKRIVNGTQMIDILRNTPVGETIPITVVRDRKTIVRKVTIGGMRPRYWTWTGEPED